jgi:hypothetical protein
VPSPLWHLQESRPGQRHTRWQDVRPSSCWRYFKDQKWNCVSPYCTSVVNFGCINNVGSSSSWSSTSSSVPPVVVTKMAVFWVVPPCNLVQVYRRFRGLYRLHHQGDVFIITDRLHGGSTDLWNFGKLVPIYAALQPIRQPSSYRLAWESQVQFVVRFEVFSSDPTSASNVRNFALAYVGTVLLSCTWPLHFSNNWQIFT